jgi:hypothetical protein
MSELRDNFDEDDCKLQWQTPSDKIQLAVYRSNEDIKGELATFKDEQKQKNAQYDHFVAEFDNLLPTIDDRLNEKFDNQRGCLKTMLYRLKTEVEAQYDEKIKTLEGVDDDDDDDDEDEDDKGIVDALADKRLETLEGVVVDNIIATADIAMAVEERLMISTEEIKRSNVNESSRLESKLNLCLAFGLAVIVIAVLFLIQANWTSLACGIGDLVSKAGRSKETLMSKAAQFQEFVLSMVASARKIRIVIQE